MYLMYSFYPDAEGGLPQAFEYSCWVYRVALWAALIRSWGLEPSCLWGVYVFPVSFWLPPAWVCLPASLIRHSVCACSVVDRHLGQAILWPGLPGISTVGYNLRLTTTPYWINGRKADGSYIQQLLRHLQIVIHLDLCKLGIDQSGSWTPPKGCFFSSRHYFSTWLQGEPFWEQTVTPPPSGVSVPLAFLTTAAFLISHFCIAQLNRPTLNSVFYRSRLGVMQPY